MENLEKVKKIKIGNVEIDSCVALAPMAGITDMPLRKLIRRFSKKCLLTTEMISSEFLMQNRKDGGEILQYEEDEAPLAFQLSGHKPWMMAKAAKMLVENADRISGATIIDINMGCPVKKVVSGGDGAALMRTPELAADIVKAVKDAVDVPVTVKFRLGWNAEEKNFLEFAKLMEEAGADAMTIHCRTRAQMYSGTADWAAIKDVKKEISVPLYANGDIVDPRSAFDCLKASNADGIAIGRGMLGSPDLLHRIEYALENRELCRELTLPQKIELAKDHLDDEIRLRGEKGGICFMRKFYPYYIKGFNGASAFRGDLVTCPRYVKTVVLLNTIAELHELQKYER